MWCPPPPPRCRLEKMIEALLSTLRETEVLDAVPSLVQVLENFTGSLVKVTHAENGRSKLDAALVSQPMAKTRVLFTWMSRPSPCLLSSLPSALLLSLQRPVTTLMVEIATLINTTHVDLSKVVEGMQRAIEDTVKAVQQV